MAAIDRRFRLWLCLIIGTGTAIRLILAFTTDGIIFDLESLGLVSGALKEDPLSVYGTERWPYPPGFLPFDAAAQKTATLTGLAFTSLVRIPAIAADAGMAWVVQWGLGLRGAPARTRLAGAGLVAFGPSFAAISAFGQIDAVAILPAVAAVILWMHRERTPRRTLAIGLLIGVGAAIKTVPIFLLLALLPTARSKREGAILVGSAVAVPLVLLAPFLATHWADTVAALGYHGHPGQGGLSLLFDPALGRGWINGGAGVPFDGLSKLLFDHTALVLLAGLALAAPALALRRPHALGAALLVWLALYVFGVSFFIQYLIWALPFLILAGRLRIALAVQLALLPATVISHAKPVDDPTWATVFTLSMDAFWVACAIAFAYLALRPGRASVAVGGGGSPTGPASAIA